MRDTVCGLLKLQQARWPELAQGIGVKLVQLLKSVGLNTELIGAVLSSPMLSGSLSPQLKYKKFEASDSAVPLLLF